MLKLLIMLVCCLFTAVPALAAKDTKITSTASKAGNICRRAIEIAEISNKIPGELLQAIGLIESGKWNEKEKSLIAWPWTVTAEGKGHYFDSFNDAYRAIRKYQKKGITNIDVGCLQINLAAHGKNFITVKEILDPVNNVAYGASFLTHLRQREHSWTRAVKFYHSANRLYHAPYSKKVIKTWQDLRKAKVQNKKDTKGTNTQISSIARSSSNGYKSQKQLETLARTKLGITTY